MFNILNERERERVKIPLSLKPKIIKILLLVVFVVSIFSFSFKLSLAATYYVDADITDTNVASATPDCTNYDPFAYACSGGSASAYKTIADINAGSFSPGDNIYFKKGEVWREQFVIPSSGTSGNIITFSSYGTGNAPVITGLNDITGVSGDWTDEGSNIWSKSLTTNSKFALFNSVTMGTEDTTPDAQYDFYWSTNKLYVYATANPTSYYTTIEVSQRTGVIHTNNKDYVTISGITVTGGQRVGADSTPQGCVHVRDDSDYVTVQNSTVNYCHGYGILVTGSIYTTLNNNSISNVESHNIGSSGDGITFRKHQTSNAPPNQGTVSNNTISTYIDRMGIAIISGTNLLIDSNSMSGEVIDLEPNNSIDLLTNITISNNTFERIAVTGPDTDVSGITIEDNTIDADRASSHTCILLSALEGTSNYVRRNTINDCLTAFDLRTGTYSVTNNTITNVMQGIVIAYYATATISNNSFSGIDYDDNNDDGVRINNDDTGNSVITVNNNIFRGFFFGLRQGDTGTTLTAQNNTFYNYSSEGIYLASVSSTNTFKNNIFYNSGSFTYHVEKLSAATYVADNNVFYPSGNYFRYHGGSGVSLSSWKTSSSQDTNSTTTSPLFLNSSGSYSQASDFQLQSTSTAIDAGTPISGLTTDYAGNSIYGLPDIGGYEYQPPYTFASYNIPTTGSVRMYSNGKYRMTTASTTSATGSFSVAPVGSYYTASTSQYMDITINTWQTTGDKNKQWTATSTAGSGLTQATSTVYTIGNLATNSYYQFKLDGSASTTAITGATCSNGTCLTDSSGNLTFTYVGGYSTHTFGLEKDVTAPSAFTLTSPINNSLGIKTDMNWTASSDPESNFAKYQLYIDGTLDTDNIPNSTRSVVP